MANLFTIVEEDVVQLHFAHNLGSRTVHIDQHIPVTKRHRLWIVSIFHSQDATHAIIVFG